MTQMACQRPWLPFRLCCSSSETANVRTSETVLTGALSITSSSGPVFCLCTCSGNYRRSTCRVKACNKGFDRGSHVHRVRLVRVRAVPQIHNHDLAGSKREIHIEGEVDGGGDQSVRYMRVRWGLEREVKE